MLAAQCNKVRQETGEPSSCRDHRARTEADIEAKLTALAVLTTADLQIEWRKLYQATPPARLSRDLLIRGVAYKIQEQAHGSLTLRTKRLLRSLAQGSKEQGRSSAAPAISLKFGTKLVREWRGQVHMVTVLAHGFEYRDARYRSLTQITKVITGTHWSGPVFFGLRSRPSRVQSAAMVGRE
jgi:Protein of unknown function (DUF2924)